MNAHGVARSSDAPLLVGEAVSESDWDRYVEGHPHGTADHLWGWREVFDGVFGHEPVYLVAHRDRRMAGILPLVKFKSRLFGRFVVSVPFLNYGGVLSSDAAAARALVERAGEVTRAFGATHLELRHVDRLHHDLPHRQHKLAMTRPLPSSSDALWHGLDRKVRNQVRKAQKEGLTAAVGGVELVDPFYAVFAENMRDLGTPVYPQRLFREILHVFPDRVRIFLVRKGAVATAGAVMVTCRQTALVPWASSLRAFRQLCPNMLLYWTMLEWAATQGFSVFDFGRSTPGAGTHQFKLQWGASETPMHWEYVLVTRSTPPEQGPSNPRFSLAIEAWKRLPLCVANRLGPAIVRNIP